MSKLFLMLAVVFSSPSTVIGGFYVRKTKNYIGAGSLYNLLYIFFAIAGWGILFLINGTYNFNVLLFSFAFGLSYSTCQIGTINAIKNGPVLLTSLISSFSLMVTVIWGFLFWEAEFTVKSVIGLVLVAVSIYFCVYVPQKDKRDKQFSLKWLIFVLMAFFGNAGCTIFQRTQQMKYNGQYGQFMMFFALLFSFAVCFIMFLKEKPENTQKIILKAGFLPALAGAVNVVLNLLVMLLATSELSPDLIYPAIGVGGLSISLIMSFVFFREKMSVRQIIGILVGVLAIFLLS